MDTTIKIPVVRPEERPIKQLVLPDYMPIVTQAYMPPMHEIDRLLAREQFHHLRAVLCLIGVIGLALFVVIEMLIWRML